MNQIAKIDEWTAEPVTDLQIHAASHRQSICSIEQRIIDTEANMSRVETVAEIAEANEVKRHAEAMEHIRQRRSQLLDEASDSIAKDRASLAYHRTALAHLEGQPSLPTQDKRRKAA